MRIWRYCDICGRSVVYKPDVFETRESMSRELDIRMQEHQLHLCKTCRNLFAECNGRPVFGECKGRDNVVDCQGYVADTGGCEEGQGEVR